MLRISGLRQILVISSVILLLSTAIINSGNKTTRYNRLMLDAQAVMENWNGVERIKNDFLVNRSNMNVLGDFEYKKNVSNWEDQVYNFEILFSQFLKEAGNTSLTEFSSSNLQYLSIIWRSTQTKLKRIQELLNQLEKDGLDDLLFPELLNNYFTYRMTDKINFDENILLMNLLNQFAFLDISSKEFYRLINSYTNALQLEHEHISNRLKFLSWITLFMFIFAIVLVYFSFKEQKISSLHIEEYKRNEKNTALKRFIKGLESWENIIQKISDKEIESEKKAILVMMKFNSYSLLEAKFGPTEINRRLSELAGNIETELKNQSLHCLLIPFEEGIAAFHYLSGKLLSETNIERTERLIAGIKSIIKDKTDFSFTYTYGSEHRFPDETQESFKEVYEASYYKILFGYEKIISAKEIEKRRGSSVHYPIQLEKSLTEYIRQGNIDKAKEIYTEIMGILTNSNYSEIRNGINRVVVTITSALDTLEKFNNLSDDLDLIDFTRNIYSMETLSEINDSIFKLIDHVASELAEKKENYKNSQISQINEIIQRDFSNPNLSTTLISEQLKLSGAYLSRIFRHQTGASIQETINRKRVETAKELLLNEDATIADICKSVGIVNDMYFYTLFKKYFGKTPKEYRQKYK